MMIMEGGLSSNMQVMERFDFFCRFLGCGSYNQKFKSILWDEGRLSETLCIIQRATSFGKMILVKSKKLFPGKSSILRISWSTPTRKLSLKEQSKRIKEGISKREKELSKVVPELEKTYQVCQRELDWRFYKVQVLKREPRGVSSLLTVKYLIYQESQKDNQKETQIQKRQNRQVIIICLQELRQLNVLHDRFYPNFYFKLRDKYVNVWFC